MAGRLRRLGIGEGSRVAILEGNTLAALTFFWGVIKSGAQSVDVPLLTDRRSLERILAESRPAAIATSPRMLAELTDGGALDALPDRVFHSGPADLAASRPGLELHSLPEICETEAAGTVR